MSRKRNGIIGTTVGLGIAAGTAGVAYVVDRSVAARRTAAVREQSQQLGSLPADRSGFVGGSDGTGLYYEEVGPADAAVTVVFAHGYTLNLECFHFQRQALGEAYGDQIRLVFYDQRSHGRSERSAPESCNIDQLGEDLSDIIDTLAPTGAVVLVGHSMGGMTVMALAQRYPQLFNGKHPRVAAVALISTSAGKLASVTLGLPALVTRARSLVPVVLRGARRQATLVERGRGLGSDIAWVLIRRFAFADSSVDPAVVEFLTAMIAACRIEVIADFYGTLMSHNKLEALPVLAGTPTTIICGDSDALTPIAHSRDLAEALPSAQLVEVPQAGHLVIMEKPEPVDAALIELIAPVLREATHRRWLGLRRPQRRSAS